MSGWKFLLSLSDGNRCLPNSCQTYEVKHGDTCVSIARSFQLTSTNVLSFNPTLNFQCSNLIIGETICLSPPAGWYTPVQISYPAPDASNQTMPWPSGTGLPSGLLPGTLSREIRPTATSALHTTSSCSSDSPLGSAQVLPPKGF